MSLVPSSNINNVPFSLVFLQESLRRPVPDHLASNLNRTLSTSAELNHSPVPSVGHGQVHNVYNAQMYQVQHHHHQPQQHQGQSPVSSFHPGPPRIVYNDLCNFPKTSNYGSMKKKKNKDMIHNVGVSARL